MPAAIFRCVFMYFEFKTIKDTTEDCFEEYL